MNFSILVLRVLMGQVMFYAGITKVLNPEWSAAGYLNNAKTFSEFFAWFAQPDVLPIVNLVNEWGLTLLGVSLILGVFVRLSSYLGIVLMFLYYFSTLPFPYISPNTYIVEYHIIYAAVFFFFAKANVGKYLGLDSNLINSNFLAGNPRLKKLLLGE